ncbi:MAG TPA: hypothetical protein VNH40_09305, partial [Gaiellaceae bacterium]|nr:hypothetical protein [Gaiellaceae bacterium]
MRLPAALPATLRLRRDLEGSPGAIETRPSRWPLQRVAALALLTIVALVGWQGVTTAGRDYELDARAHLEYAQYFSHHAAPPPRAQNYEFTNPPLFAILAVGAEKAVRVLPSHPVGFSSNALTRGVWLVLALGGALAMTAPRRRLRLAGASALLVSALWG